MHTLMGGGGDVCVCQVEVGRWGGEERGQVNGVSIYYWILTSELKLYICWESSEGGICAQMVTDCFHVDVITFSKCIQYIIIKIMMMLKAPAAAA